jgi:hypothetical protein
VTVKGDAARAIETVYVAEEDLAAEPQPVEAHHAELMRLRPPEEPRTKAAEEATAKAHAEAKKVLQQGGADPKLVEELDAMKDPSQMFARVMQYAEEKIKELEALTETFKQPPPG